MIKAIARRKYWEIVVAGVLSSVTIILLLAFAARWLTATWHGAGDGIHIAYILISAATAWIVTGIFIEAAFHKHRQKQADLALDRIMDLIAGHQALGVASPYYKQGAPVVDLAEKEDDRG
jgi:uncharacterized membrane protein (DUF485 family)